MDIAKEGGDPLGYISTTIPSRKLTLPTVYKILEVIAVDQLKYVKIGMTFCAVNLHTV